MKRGLRKLCDIPCHLAGAVELRAELEDYLAQWAIPFEVSSHVDRKHDRDFWRYAVPSIRIDRARGGLPLKLRGFRAVTEGGGS
jgi:hypothetical protein